MAHFTLRPLLRIFLLILLSFTALSLVAGTILYLNYFSWRPSITKAIPEGIKNRDEASSLLGYFRETYNDSREEFLQLAKREINNNPKAQIFSLPIQSSTDTDLTIDVLYLPPLGSANRLVIASSGVHGLEGATGSAMQSMMLDRFPKSAALEGTGLLFIHTVNPWGFKHQRRVTENNIDLGLNSWLASGRTSPFSEHELLDTLEALLYPPKPVGRQNVETLEFPVRGMVEIIRHGLGTVQKMLLQGQSDQSNGLYYRGSTAEEHFSALAPVIKSIATEYRVVLGLDFHVGYGPRGEILLFPQESSDSRAKILLKDLFEGYTIQLDDVPGYVPMGGGFSAFIEANLPADAIYLPMVIEYGSSDSTGLPGYLRVLQAFVHENQAFLHGAAQEADLVWAKNSLVEILYPASATWRLNAIMASRNLLDQAITRFQSP